MPPLLVPLWVFMHLPLWPTIGLGWIRWRCFGQDRRWESILGRRPPSKEALVVRLLSCGASLTFWANATGQSPEPHPLRSIAAAIPEAPMGILISFGSSGGEWVTRFPFYESVYASPSWRRCYMMAAGAFKVFLVAFRVVIFLGFKNRRSWGGVRNFNDS